MVRNRLTYPGKRELLDQTGRPDLDEMNAGGFQWLNEAARQAKRHAVLAPHLLATTGLVTDQARFGQWLPIDMAKQIFLCLVRLHILAAEDKAVADPVL